MTTTKFGLLGRVLGHSLSPEIHNDFNLDYSLFEVEPNQLENFLLDGDWKGLNVTIPYKQDVMNYADVLDPLTKRIGASNTLVKHDNKIYAYNTDYFGFKWLLDSFCIKYYNTKAINLLKGKDILVLGSGGASKAVCCVLEDLGACVHIVSRTGTTNYSNFTTLVKDAHLLINTTPVGMYPKCPKSPITTDNLKSLPHLLGVVDIVYNPINTGIYLQAKQLGIPCECGIGMLVAQAYQANLLFNPRPMLSASYLIPKEMDKLNSNNQNIVLIGMPGVGKTTIAKAISSFTNYKFVDTDLLFEETYHITPAKYIRKYGEEKFRDKESSIIKQICNLTHCVIATGGGCVTRDNNYSYLKQNSVIVWLQRDINKLTNTNRPISIDKSIKNLAETRYPLYNAWCDIVFNLSSNIKYDAKSIYNIIK